MSGDAGALKAAIRAFWAGAPMTYGQQHGEATYHRPDGTVETVPIGSARFFELADEVFHRWNAPLHLPDAPFGRIFDYAAHRDRPVLEVGCGMGCMAMHWARQGARLTAVDLNPVAVAQTRRRFEVLGLHARIEEADAESLPFADRSFDFVYSWGVLHHTPGIRTALAEVHRVLAPGGKVGLMLYHRHSLLHAAQVAWQEGFVNMESLSLDALELSSRYGDGGREEGNPHTWPVTHREVVRDLLPDFVDVEVRVLGTDVPETLGTWLPGMGRWLPPALVRALSRRWGWSLWITARRPAA